MNPLAGRCGGRCGRCTRQAGTPRRRTGAGSSSRAIRPYGGLYYNVACCEALAGQSAEAIAHLRRAIELADVTREYAAQDSDLDSIRDDPAFAALLAASA